MVCRVEHRSRPGATVLRGTYFFFLFFFLSFFDFFAMSTHLPGLDDSTDSTAKHRVNKGFRGKFNKDRGT
jgi:hypothetical protein